MRSTTQCLALPPVLRALAGCISINPFGTDHECDGGRCASGSRLAIVFPPDKVDQVNVLPNGGFRATLHVGERAVLYEVRYPSDGKGAHTWARSSWSSESRGGPRANAVQAAMISEGVSTPNNGKLE